MSGDVGDPEDFGPVTEIANHDHFISTDRNAARVSAGDGWKLVSDPTRAIG